MLLAILRKEHLRQFWYSGSGYILWCNNAHFYLHKIQLSLWTTLKYKLVWFQSHSQSELVSCTDLDFCWMFKLEFLFSLKKYLDFTKVNGSASRDLQVAPVSATSFFILVLSTMTASFTGLRGCFYLSAISQ